MDQVMAGQVNVLREQMVSAHTLTDFESPEDQPVPPMFGPGMIRHIMRGMPGR